MTTPRFLQCLIIALVAVSGASAFTVVGNNNNKSMISTRTVPSAFSTQTQTATSSTALSLKLNVKELEKNASNKNTSANVKGAAYGGSIVIAILLPVAFLVWSATSH
eukprot:CAMPEP_0202487126 /NCGR_PEP_ID=MMETSP1361-20130828/5545_1 /ASSEMBLY_ACC=CAM_ASM_000849 /TAXON_ID=210615 /ORGANISM="Staurosira complex sp., Strain CCMP2646" /LENGTH=106 /DNA_ID=CAMNT_0049116445 /DNA_START=36 /DNA_END=356 /DNA_ORIENTATION=+